ncbi:hypothetical protein PTSG_10292 [Salpingoeca rosetta]|uniref:Exportin-1/Importin-beta-like domain-containing protein n=1 Tax=Salpingoeca rosetta (strain ATCC 50818 / BSB-021) TaxID=946362 RepID=F2UQW3_SALR5|nr:uncharacterized protein PTSG_10292 [Salpingoeca rosetta]EGD80018.1 hypothetical protein PTSG_10292 [Salpingoeca rosetta]|eukprot:XP_004988343.1 hypothetical protein PTSG_10292 [Salpingoeca rosetta]
MLAAQGAVAHLRARLLPEDVDQSTFIQYITAALMQYKSVKPLRNQFTLIMCVYVLRHHHPVIRHPRQRPPHAGLPYTAPHAHTTDTAPVGSGDTSAPASGASIGTDASGDDQSTGVMAALSELRDHILAQDPSAEWLWMHIVSLIPEEVDRKEFKLATAERNALHQILREHAGMIITHGMDRMDSRENPSLFQACVRVCNAWCASGFVTFADMKPVIASLISWLQHTAAEAVQAGTDVYLDEDVMFTRVTELLMTCTETFTTGEATAFMGDQVLIIADGCHHYLSLARLVRSFVCCAKAHLFTDLQTEQWQLLLEHSIACTSSANPRIADEMVLLWSTLPETLKSHPMTQAAVLPYLKRALEAVVFQGQLPQAVTADGDEWDRITTLRESVRACLRNMLYDIPGLGPWFVNAVTTALRDALRTVTEDTWPQAEALIHGTSAVARRLFDALDADTEEGACQRAFVELCCQVPEHPAMLCTVALLFGVITTMLPGALLPMVRHTVMKGLSFSEEADVFPMRIYEDHVSVVALIKLARVLPDPAFFSELWQAYQSPQVQQSLTVRSFNLLLEAICETLCHPEVAQDQAAVAEFLNAFFNETARVVASNAIGEDLDNAFARIQVISRTIRKEPSSACLHATWMAHLDASTEGTLLKSCLTAAIATSQQHQHQHQHQHQQHHGSVTPPALVHPRTASLSRTQRHSRSASPHHHPSSRSQSPHAAQPPLPSSSSLSPSTSALAPATAAVTSATSTTGAATSNTTAAVTGTPTAASTPGSTSTTPTRPTLAPRSQSDVPVIGDGRATWLPAPQCISGLCECMEVVLTNLAVYSDQLGQQVLAAVGSWQPVFTSPHDPKVLEMVTMRSSECAAIVPVLVSALRMHAAYSQDEACFQSFCDLVSCCCTMRPDAVAQSGALPDILSTYLHAPIAEIAARNRAPFTDKPLVSSLCRMAGVVLTAQTAPQRLLLADVYGEGEASEGEAGRVLNTLLLAVCGGLPSWALDDIMQAIRTIMECLSADVTSQLLYGAMCQPTFARPDVSDKAKLIFLEDFQRLGATSDWKRLKNAVKKFCGGKKKNTSGTPAIGGGSGGGSGGRVRTRSAPTI